MLIRRFIREEAAATSIEYALVAGIVSIVILTATLSIGVKLNANYFGPVASGLN